MSIAAKGDKEAFGQLFNRYYPGILNFFWRLVWDHAKAEELAQDVFLKLWKNRKHYKGTGKFSTYLFQIAKNHWVNYLRRKKRYKAFLDSKTEEIKQESWGSTPAPEEELADKEIEQVVKEAVDSLPETYRVPFVLSRFNNFKYKDIAEILGISSRTVEWRIAEAYDMLGKKLSKLMES